MPIESLFRSLSLVLLDNASAEFTFIVRFFAASITPIGPRKSTSTASSNISLSKEALKEAERIYHEVLDPALEYCNTFCQNILSPSPPPAVPLLTMIRLNDKSLAACDQRGALPLVSFFQAQKLAMWPVYRKAMDSHVESLKRLADEAEGKGLAGFMGRGTKDGTVRHVATRYAALFTCCVALSDEADEVMLFSR